MSSYVMIQMSVIARRKSILQVKGYQCVVQRVRADDTPSYRVATSHPLDSLLDPPCCFLHIFIFYAFFLKLVSDVLGESCSFKEGYALLF